MRRITRTVYQVFVKVKCYSEEEDAVVEQDIVIYYPTADEANRLTDLDKAVGNHVLKVLSSKVVAAKCSLSFSRYIKACLDYGEIQEKEF